MNKNFIYLILLLFGLTGCYKDGDLLTISSITDNELIASESKITLSAENNTTIVLSFAWNINELTASSPNIIVPEASTTLEMSDNESFEGNVLNIVVSNNSKAFTGGELNTYANELGLVNGEINATYFRLAAASGSNITPIYSEVIQVDITPYKIDFTTGLIMTADAETGVMSATGQWLSSPEESGVYYGFMGAPAWSNFYVQEGDGTIWGNDGINGTAFELSSSTNPEERWNCWFPAVSGSYYVEFDTNKKEWTANNITKLSVSGDLAGEMSFARDKNTWTLNSLNVENGKTYQVQLEGATNIYNKDTGDSETSITGSVFFAQEGDMVVKADAASLITITAKQSGKLALILDLNDPTNLTLTLGDGGEEPITIPEYLYVVGVDDGITGGDWNFNNSLVLTSNTDDEQFYTGVLNVNSLWGYSFNPINGDWDTKYDYAEGDAYTGNLANAGGNNIPTPDAGLYLYQVSTSAMTYSLTALGSEVYVQGIDDVWDWNTPLAATTTPGVYAGEVTFTGSLPWGMKIMLEKENWDLGYGCSAGELSFGESGTTNDPELTGTYTLTVNLIERTYTITDGSGDGSTYPSEIYALGIDNNWSNWTTTLAADESIDGIYSGSVEIADPANTSIKFYTEKENWDTEYGVWQEGGTIGLGWSEGINVDQAGTYQLTVNLSSETFTITLQ